MTIRNKLYLGFFTLSGILLLLGLTSWFYLNLLEKKANVSVEREKPAIKLALELHKGAYNATIEQLKYLLYETPVPKRHTEMVLAKMKTDVTKFDQLGLQFNNQDLLKQSSEIKQNIIDFNILYELGIKALVNNKHATKSMNKIGKQLLAEADSFVIKQQLKYSEILYSADSKENKKNKIQKYIVANQIKTLTHSIIQHEKQERLYKDREFYKKIQKELPELLALYNKLHGLSKGGSERKKIKKARKTTEQYKKAISQWVSHDTKLKILVTKINTIAETTRKSTAHAVQNGWFKADETNKKTIALFSQAHSHILYTLAIGFFIGIIIAIAILRNIVKSINTLSRFAKRFGIGDLSARTHLSSSDELGLMAKNFDFAAENLQRIIREIDTNSLELTQYSNSLSKITDTNSTQLNDQKQLIEQAATAMSQMAITVEEIVKNSTQAASASNAAETLAIKSYLVISQAVTSINSLAKEINQATFVINQLEDDIEDISKFVSEIKNITEPINQLALNVENEANSSIGHKHQQISITNDIKPLANNTRIQSDKIQSMLIKLLFDTKKAISAIEASHKMIEDSIQHTNKSGETLQSMTQSTSMINHMNTLIASTAEEQSTVAEAINQNILTINKISEKSVKAADETSKSSKDLVILANNLKQSISSLSV